MTTTARTTTKSFSRELLPLLRTPLVRSPLIPHAFFWGVGFVIKIALPVLLRWVAYDSICAVLLTVWYPLCATISLVRRDLQHQYQQQQQQQQQQQHYQQHYQHRRAATNTNTKPNPLFEFRGPWQNTFGPATTLPSRKN